MVKHIAFFIKKYYKKYLSKSYKKYFLILYYTQFMLLNNNKFKYWFMMGLNSLLSKIFKKKVRFNIINIKYLYLNCGIFAQAISTKLRNRKNRLLRVMKKALKVVKLPTVKKYFYYDKYDFVTNKRNPVMLVRYNILHSILNNIKYRITSGVRLEATGRLSKRLTASRSVFKFKYKGSLKNIDSSYKGLSSIMMRGHSKANVEYTTINSKTRIGSFGLKSWVSGF